MELKKATGVPVIYITKNGMYKFIVAMLLVLAVGMAHCMQLQAMQQQSNPTMLTKNNVSKKYPTNEFQAAALKKVLSVNLQSVTLEQGLKTIAHKAGLKLVYSKNIIPAHTHVSLKKRATTLENALWALLAGTGLRFGVSSNNHLVIMKRAKEDKKTVQRVQAEMVSGTVSDAQSGETLPGVNILVKGTSTGTATGSDGTFELSVESLQDTLVFSFIGYQPQEVPIDGRTTIDVALQSQAISGEEMVVIGYGEQAESEITGAISTVSSDDLNQVSAVGVQDALQGRISGVNVTPQDGRPGGKTDVNIRGVTTLGDNNPLYVIDGVPIFSHQTSASGGFGEGGNNNPLASLSPNDIESVEVLKDASAAAIYGARAANGVILVTTKSGHEGETQFSVNLKAGAQAVPEYKFIDMMNSKQFLDFTKEAYQNADITLPISVQEPNLSENLARNTDWQHAGFNPAATQNYSFNVSGGSNTTTYALSGGYTNDQGTLINSGFKRYSVRSKLKFNINKSIDVGGTINLSRSIWKGLYNPTRDFIQELVQQAPTVPIYDDDNPLGFGGPLPRYSPVNRDNKIGRFTVIDQNTTHNRVIGNAYFEYNFLDNMSYRISLSADLSLNSDYVFDPKYQMGNRSNDQADLNERSMSDESYIVDNTLNYKNTFAGVHDVSALIGYSVQESNFRYISAGISGFPSNDIRVINGGTGSYGVGGDRTEWGLISEIGRINYTYDNRYTMMATIRRDGSSRFGSNKKYGFFPSFSGRWNITNESFMEGVDGISEVSLRASWGEVGNQDIANYAARSGIDPGADYIIGDGQSLVPGATYITMGNPDLGWETTKETNIGVNMSVLDGALSMTADYYYKNTDGILLRVPIPSTSGINRDNGPFVNAGSMENKGLEFEAIYQHSAEDFYYSISGNISSNRNEVTSLGRGQESIISTVRIGYATATMTTITKPGEAVGSYFGYIADGTFYDQADVDNHATQPKAKPGDVKFRDINNDGVININDKAIIGNPFPDFTYGLSINLNYKDFGFVVSIQGKQGHDIYNLTWSDLNTTPQFNNQTTMMLKRWTPNNRNTDVPRAVKNDPNNNNRVSTRFVEDGSYLRIRNIRLGYSLNSELVSKMGLSQLRLFGSVKNLYTFTNYRGYNPEIGVLSTGPRASLSRGVDLGVYPIPRTIEGGLEIHF